MLYKDRTQIVAVRLFSSGSLPFFCTYLY